MIIESARECLGTPFHHQGRIPKVGLDCIGLVLHVAIQNKYLDESVDRKDYSRIPNVEMMESELNKYLDKIPNDELQPGDIVWLSVRNEPSHVAIFTGYSIIHAISTPPSKVVEHRWDSYWQKRLVGVFRFREK